MQAFKVFSRMRRQWAFPINERWGCFKVRRVHLHAHLAQRNLSNCPGSCLYFALSNSGAGCL
jgi:hypothetical protein